MGGFHPREGRGTRVCTSRNLEHMQLITAAVHFHRPVRILAVKVCQFPFDAIVVVHKLAVCQYRILEQEQGLQVLPRCTTFGQAW